MKPVLLDTGVIIALLDRRELYHSNCVKAIEELERPMVTCEAVIAETCYLLRGVQDAPETVLANVENRIFQIPFQLSRSTSSIRRIMHKYSNIPASFADACLIHLADELDTGDILTLDQDFELYRWRGNRTFQNLIKRD